MKRTLFSATLLLFSIHLFAQGPLFPPGPPGPTQRTLTELAPRQPISEVPITISEPGSYYLTGNLTVTDPDGSLTAAININSSDVTLDLNGFTLSGPNTVNFGLRIVGTPQAPRRNIRIHSGNLHGFSSGIFASHLINGQFENLVIQQSSSSGVILSGTNRGSRFWRCTIIDSGSWGLSLSASGSASVLSGTRVEECVIAGNIQRGISIVSTNGALIEDTLIQNSVIAANSGSGLQMEAGTDSLIRGTQVRGSTLHGNSSRGVNLRLRNGEFHSNAFTGNTISQTDNAGFLASADQGMGGQLIGTVIQNNTISHHRFNGGIRLVGSQIAIEQSVIRDNLLADNGIGTAQAHFQITEAEKNLVQGNHISGAETAPSRGLNLSNTSGNLVVKNSVVGEPFTTTANDHTGELGTVSSLPNSAWLNFHLP